MLLTCVRKEILSYVLSLRYGLVFCLLVGLTLAATAVRTSIYRKQKAAYAESIGERQRTLEMLWDTFQFASRGIVIETPPNPLAIFAGGLENEITRSHNFAGQKTPRTGLRKLNNASFRYFLDIDLILVVNIVGSLLALMLVFDGICGEREQGTLKVLLAGPIPRDTVILSKIIAGLLILALPLLLAWGFSLAYVVGVGGVVLDAELTVRVMWLIALSLVYVSFFFALGIALSSWVRDSASAMAGGVFAWAILVLVVPNLVPLALKRLAPVPPESKLLMERDAIRETIEKEDMPKWREEMTAAKEYDDQQQLWRMLVHMVDEECDRRFEPLERYAVARVVRRLRLNQRIARISPSASFVFAATHCAGTGAEDFLHALSEVEAYGRRFREVFHEKQTEHLKRPRETRHAPYATDAWPPFEPSRLSIAQAVNACWLDVVWLAGSMVVLFLGAVVGFMRYDAR
ncbi:MAG: ABC transporter permease subunit [Chitinivibrionales bacterium]|nr:ABC transporter permease subunit [Chitinivibrionales bacterium]